MNISNYAWTIANMSAHSRADLNLSLQMFMENIRLGKERYHAFTDIIIDYKDLKSQVDIMSKDELHTQIKELLYIFEAEHSKLLKFSNMNDQDSFETLILEASDRLFDNEPVIEQEYEEDTTIPEVQKPATKPVVATEPEEEDVEEALE